MYKELEYFSGAAGKAILYKVVVKPMSAQSKDTKNMMINGSMIFIEKIGMQPVKPTVDAEYVLVVENYKTKEFQIKKYESEKQATYMWYDCASKISQLTPVPRQR